MTRSEAIKFMVNGGKIAKNNGFYYFDSKRGLFLNDDNGRIGPNNLLDDNEKYIELLTFLEAMEKAQEGKTVYLGGARYKWKNDTLVTLDGTTAWISKLKLEGKWHVE